MKLDNETDYDLRSRQVGYAFLLIFFGGFGSWAAFAPLESAAHGSGKVQVQGSSQPVQHLEGGLVSQILVANGEFVEKGQPLIELDDTRARAELDILQGRHFSRMALVDRLECERDNCEFVVFSSWLLNSEDARAAMSVDNEQAIFAARRADLQGEMSVLESRILRLQKQKSGAEAVLSARREVTVSLEAEIAELESLLADGYVDKQRIRELRRSLVRSLGEISDLESEIASFSVAVSETELQILQLEKRFKTGVVDDLNRAQEDLYSVQQQLLAASDRANRSTITAPTSGVVAALDLNTRGAVVGPGQELLIIVPDIDKLVVSAKLSPMDIDRIRIGQEVEVRFSVFKDAYTITGILTKVSADSLVDEQTGKPYFSGLVELLESDLKLLGEYKLVPGMPAEVLVKTGSRSFLAFLTSRIGNMWAQSLNQD